MQAPSSDDLTYYQMLEIAVDATPEDIKQAYVRIAEHLTAQSLATYSIVDEHDIEFLRSALEKAYLTLIDPEARRAYNTSLGLGIVSSASSHSVSYIAMPETSVVQPVQSARDHVLSNPKHDVSEIVRAPDEKPADHTPKGVQWSAQKNTRVFTHITPDTEFNGPFLKTVREGCEATLEDVFRVTKVSVKYLHALEENDYKNLPSPAYIKGYVREYARFLGLDPVVVSNGYMQAMSRRVG